MAYLCENDEESNDCNYEDLSVGKLYTITRLILEVSSGFAAEAEFPRRFAWSASVFEMCCAVKRECCSIGVGWMGEALHLFGTKTNSTKLD